MLVEREKQWIKVKGYKEKYARKMRIKKNIWKSEWENEKGFGVIYTTDLKDWIRERSLNE